MSWGSPIFVLILVAMSTIAWIITSAIRAKHGYPLEGEWGGKVEKLDTDLRRQNALLENENELLRGKIGRIEERIGVLERIATDAPARLTSQIDALR